MSTLPVREFSDDGPLKYVPHKGIKMTKPGLLALCQEEIEHRAGYHIGDIFKVISKKRDPELVMVRAIIVWILRDLNYSYPSIGNVINHHHSTCISLMDYCKKGAGLDPAKRSDRRDKLEPEYQRIIELVMKSPVLEGLRKK